MPFGAAIACGLVAALFYFSLLTGSPGAFVLVYLVQLPLFGAGLALGVKGAVVASGTAAAATAYGAGTLVALIFLFTQAMPVILLVGQALRRRSGADGTPVCYPAGGLVATLVLIGAGVLSAAFAVLASQPEGVVATIEAYLHQALGPLLAEAGSTAEPAAILPREVTALLPALSILGWLTMTVFNGTLAQGALARFGWSRRPSPDIAELELPRWLAAPLAAALVLAVAASGDLALYGRNLLPVLAFA